MPRAYFCGVHGQRKLPKRCAAWLRSRRFAKLKIWFFGQEVKSDAAQIVLRSCFDGGGRSSMQGGAVI